VRSDTIGILRIHVQVSMLFHTISFNRNCAEPQGCPATIGSHVFLKTQVYARLAYLSAIGTSLPVALLYWPRMKSEICSSLACSMALSLSCLPWPRKFSWT